MSAVIDRALGILEYLSTHPEGVPLAAVAEAVACPKSACHRLLTDLYSRGYVKQVQARGDYVLTTKVTSLGLRFLGESGIVDIAQPLIEALAEESGELARLSIVDEDRLTWVAKAEGGRKGFRYDPDMGKDAQLSCTSSGHAWLFTLTEERAVELVLRQGFGSPKEFGPKAPTTVKALLGHMHAATGARLRDDRRSLRARHGRRGCAGWATRAAGDRRDQPRGPEAALDPGTDAGSRAGLARSGQGAGLGKQRVGLVLEAAARQGLAPSLFCNRHRAKEWIAPVPQTDHQSVRSTG